MSVVEITLTEEQAACEQAVLDWLREEDAPVMTVGGYAGTGKTTVLSHLMDELTSGRRVAFAALSGKAAYVLRAKGVPANTIHSTIYVPDDGRFYLKPELIERPLDLMVCDEASMIDRVVYEDLRQVCRKILFVGDHGQLQPVGDDPYLMRDPDFRLETIHRQALDNPILKFAHDIRQGAKLFHCDFPVRKQSEFWESEAWKDREVVICGTNSTRHEINRKVRAYRFGINPEEDTLPIKGDWVMCLMNNAEKGLFNGACGQVLEVHEKGANTLFIDVKMSDGRILRRLPTQCNQYGENKAKRATNWDGELFDYAYAITAHKAQGSEYRSGVILDECYRFKHHDPSFDSARWRYTAATRFKESLEIFA